MLLLASCEGRKKGKFVLVGQRMVPRLEFIIDGDFYGFQLEGESAGHAQFLPEARGSCRFSADFLFGYSCIFTENPAVFHYDSLGASAVLKGSPGFLKILGAVAVVQGGFFRQIHLFTIERGKESAGTIYFFGEAVSEGLG
tara:strand:+ start:665 stop:1087 length:423 start_codon:yes stop_codon:yes gene_type:complete